MTHGPSKYIERLERRLAFLEDRIADYRGHSDSHDRAEAAALRWALPIVRASIQPIRQSQPTERARS